MRSDVLGLYPYWRYRIDDRLSVWGVAGYDRERAAVRFLAPSSEGTSLHRTDDLEDAPPMFERKDAEERDQDHLRVVAQPHRLAAARETERGE